MVRSKGLLGRGRGGLLGGLSINLYLSGQVWRTRLLKSSGADPFFIADNFGRERRIELSLTDTILSGFCASVRLSDCVRVSEWVQQIAFAVIIVVAATAAAAAFVPSFSIVAAPVSVAGNRTSECENDTETPPDFHCWPIMMNSLPSGHKRGRALFNYQVVRGQIQNC